MHEAALAALLRDAGTWLCGSACAVSLSRLAGMADAGAGAAAGFASVTVLTFVQLYLNTCAASAHQWIAKLLAVSGRTWPSRVQDLPVVVCVQYDCLQCLLSS